jgi:hypothetical protein
MCEDLGVDKECFDTFWKEKEEERYLGKIDFEGSILYAGNKLGKEIDSDTLAYVLNRRIDAKATCFEHIDLKVLHMLDAIKILGLRTAIVSNCSSEEVKVIRESELYRYNELQDARNAEMNAIQAKWFTNRLPQKRETIGDFPVAEEPLEILAHL